MKIKLQKQWEGQSLIIAIYWSDWTGENIRHYAVLDDPNMGTLSAHSEKNVALSDYDLAHFLLKKNNMGDDLLVHKAADCQNLEFLDGLVDGGGYDAIDVLLDNLETMKIEHGYERTWKCSEPNYYRKFLMVKKD